MLKKVAVQIILFPVIGICVFNIYKYGSQWILISFASLILYFFLRDFATRLYSKRTMFNFYDTFLKDDSKFYLRKLPEDFLVLDKKSLGFTIQKQFLLRLFLFWKYRNHIKYFSENVFNTPFRVFYAKGKGKNILSQSKAYLSLYGQSFVVLRTKKYKKNPFENFLVKHEVSHFSPDGIFHHLNLYFLLFAIYLNFIFFLIFANDLLGCLFAVLYLIYFIRESYFFTERREIYADNMALVQFKKDELSKLLKILIYKSQRSQNYLDYKRIEFYQKYQEELNSEDKILSVFDRYYGILTLPSFIITIIPIVYLAIKNNNQATYIWIVIIVMFVLLVIFYLLFGLTGMIGQAFYIGSEINKTTDNISEELDETLDYCETIVRENEQFEYGVEHLTLAILSRESNAKEICISLIDKPLNKLIKELKLLIDNKYPKEEATNRTEKEMRHFVDRLQSENKLEEGEYDAVINSMNELKLSDSDFDILAKGADEQEYFKAENHVQYNSEVYFILRDTGLRIDVENRMTNLDVLTTITKCTNQELILLLKNFGISESKLEEKLKKRMKPASNRVATDETK